MYIHIPASGAYELRKKYIIPGPKQTSSSSSSMEVVHTLHSVGGSAWSIKSNSEKKKATYSFSCANGTDPSRFGFTLLKQSLEGSHDIIFKAFLTSSAGQVPVNWITDYDNGNPRFGWQVALCAPQAAERAQKRQAQAASSLQQEESKRQAQAPSSSQQLKLESCPAASGQSASYGSRPAASGQSDSSSGSSLAALAAPGQSASSGSGPAAPGQSASSGSGRAAPGQSASSGSASRGSIQNVVKYQNIRKFFAATHSYGKKHDETNDDAMKRLEDTIKTYLHNAGQGLELELEMDRLSEIAKESDMRATQLEQTYSVSSKNAQETFQTQWNSSRKFDDIKSEISALYQRLNKLKKDKQSASAEVDSATDAYRQAQKTAERDGPAARGARAQAQADLRAFEEKKQKFDEFLKAFNVSRRPVNDVLSSIGHAFNAAILKDMQAQITGGGSSPLGPLASAFIAGLEEPSDAADSSAAAGGTLGSASGAQGTDAGAASGGTLGSASGAPGTDAGAAGAPLAAMPGPTNPPTMDAKDMEAAGVLLNLTGTSDKAA
jgi:hypothetical protein